MEFRVDAMSVVLPRRECRDGVFVNGGGGCPMEAYVLLNRRFKK